MIAVHFSDPPRKKIINDIEKKKIELIAFEKMAPHTLMLSVRQLLPERPDFVCENFISRDRFYFIFRILIKRVC